MPPGFLGRIPEVIGIAAAGEGVHGCGYAQPVKDIGRGTAGDKYSDGIYNYGDNCIYQEGRGIDEEGFTEAICRAVKYISWGVSQPKIACLVYWNVGAVAEEFVRPFVQDNAGEGDQGDYPS